MSAPTLNLADFAEKKVTITYRPDGDGEAVTKEGTVQAASAIGLIFKEKGKADVNIVEPDWIDEIEPLAEAEPKVTVKKLQPVAKNFRQHLVDRHGYKPAEVNDLTEAAGKELHDSLDHSELGHVHVAPKAQTEAQGESPISDVSDIEGAEPEDDTDED